MTADARDGAISNAIANRFIMSSVASRCTVTLAIAARGTDTHSTISRVYRLRGASGVCGSHKGRSDKGRDKFFHNVKS